MHLLPELATGHEIAIPALLAARDERQAKQRAWLTRYGTALISFTVVAPGPVKDSRLTRRVFNHGVAAMHTLMQARGWCIRGQAAQAAISGPEGMFAIDAPARDLKLAAIELEDSHPLGRLWDIDVLTPQGEILSRRHFTQAARRCLLCENVAAECARGKVHALADLLNRMEALAHDADCR